VDGSVKINVPTNLVGSPNASLSLGVNRRMWGLFTLIL